MELWVARNEGYDEEVLHDRYTHVTGELLIFYDKPELKYDSTENRRKWTNARIMGNPESYMFPEIKEEECIKFTTKSIDEICDELKSLVDKNGKGESMDS